MSDSIERRLEELRQCAKKYSKAKAECEYLSHFRKSKLAMLMKKYQLKYPENCKTAAAQEKEARCDPEYIEILEGLKEATEIEAESFWLLKIAQMGAELWRTQQASERAERKGYGA